MLSERRTNRGDVEQGQSRPKVVPIRAGPGKRTGNGNHQVCCVAILILLMSIVPLCAYFGVFRSTPATADKPQGLIVNVPVDKDPSELLQQEQQVIPQFDDEEQLTGDLLHDDHIIRSRLWKRYVGRSPLKHGEVTIKESPDPGPVVGLLNERQQFNKQDGPGWFIQHPQSEKIWLEVDNDSAEVYAWSVVDESVDSRTQNRILKCQDNSMPKRADETLKLELPPVSSSSKDLVGSYAYGKAHSAEWFAQRPLRCPSKGCVKTRNNPNWVPRKVFKSNGGMFLERAEGDVWLESNTDGGNLIFNWGVARERPEEIILMDASRSMWLKIKPAPPAGGVLDKGVVLLATGTPVKMGRDDVNPADLNEHDWSPWNLLSNACDPHRTCRAALKKQDAERKAKGLGPPLHLLFSVTAMEKFEWESRFFMYWYNTSQTLSKRGSVTRLLTAAHEDHLMDEIPTFVAEPPTEDMNRDSYVPYNKITSILQWINAKHDELPEDAIVVILDVDVVLLEDIAYLAVDVKRGHPLGTKGFMSFSNDDSPYDRMITRYCKGCKTAEPLAVPYFIHKTDLLELAPRWLEKCREIRTDTLPWSSVTDWRAYKPLQLSWTAEQWAFLLAAAEMGLKFDVREDTSAFTGCGVLELDEPMIHFSDWTKGIKNGQEFKWSKGMPNALDQIPDVDPNNKCEIDRAMINAIKDAKAHVKPTGHVFKNKYQPEF